MGRGATWERSLKKSAGKVQPHRAHGAGVCLTLSRSEGASELDGLSLGRGGERGGVTERYKDFDLRGCSGRF